MTISDSPAPDANPDPTIWRRLTLRRSLHGPRPVPASEIPPWCGRSSFFVGRRLRVSVEKKFSTALSHDPEVGVTWKVQRGWRSSHTLPLGCLWVA